MRASIERASLHTRRPLRPKLTKMVPARCSVYFWTLLLFVTGNFDAFVGVEVIANGEEVTRKMLSMHPEQRTLRYPRPAGSIIDINIRYWDGLKRVTVPLQM
jgi:hypothetical protein